MEIISSLRNPKIKALLELREKSRARKEQGLFVVEGRREIRHCIAAGYDIDTLFVCKSLSGGAGTNSKKKETSTEAPEGAQAPILTSLHGSQRRGNLFEVSREVYEKIALRDSTEGVVAEVRMKPHGLDGLDLPDNALVCVLESVEKPGNVGAILRSCDAAGVDALIICDPRCDIYNPNLIRASIGAVFTVPVAVCTSEDAIAFLKAHGMRILTAQLQDSSLYYDTDMTQGTAIVMGTEATGLTDIWREAADTHIRIPMRGQLDSLNVSVSAAILLFEAVRQRQDKI